MICLMATKCSRARSDLIFVGLAYLSLLELTEATRSRMIWDADAVEVAQGISQGAMFGMDARIRKTALHSLFQGNVI